MLAGMPPVPLQRLGKILILVPDAPAWSAWPTVIGHHERRMGAAMQKPLTQRGVDAVEVLITLAGNAVLHGPAGDLPVGVGQAVVLRLRRDAAVMAGTSREPHWRGLDIFLDGGLARSAADDLVGRHGHVMPIDPGLALWDELRAMVPGGFGHGRIWSAAEALALSGRILMALQTGSASAARAEADPLVQAALTLMHQVAALRSIQDVASRLHVSREHLSRRLAAAGLSAAGLSAADLFRRIRVERAVGLLANRHLTIAEVARRCGWRSQSSFARAVIAHTGRAPRAHRRPG
jgi:AraC-like DNA-binding protein